MTVAVLSFELQLHSRPNGPQFLHLCTQLFLHSYMKSFLFPVALFSE
jgi:hypothetical protein